MKSKKKERYRAALFALLTLALTILSTSFSSTVGDIRAKPTTLKQLLQHFAQTIATRPDETGPRWGKWRVTDNPWDIMLAAATGKDTARADLLMAMQDTTPLIAIVSTGRKQRYDYIKYNAKLNEGWDISAHSFSPKGRVDWVEIKGKDGKISIGSREDTSTPKFLVMPLKNTLFLVLSWNTIGDEFESILLYDAKQRAILACCNFALNASTVRYLFLKGDNADWMEFSYAQGFQNPVGIAVHHQMPGRFSAALLDLNKDGKMDMLAEVSTTENRINYKKSTTTLGENEKNRVEFRKKELVGHAIKANQIWLDVQGLWHQIEPLGVQLPELFKI